MKPRHHPPGCPSTFVGTIDGFDIWKRLDLDWAVYLILDGTPIHCQGHVANTGVSFHTGSATGFEEDVPLHLFEWIKAYHNLSS